MSRQGKVDMAHDGIKLGRHMNFSKFNAFKYQVGFPSLLYSQHNHFFNCSLKKIIVRKRFKGVKST